MLNGIFGRGRSHLMSVAKVSIVCRFVYWMLRFVSFRLIATFVVMLLGSSWVLSRSSCQLLHEILLWCKFTWCSMYVKAQLRSTVNLLQLPFCSIFILYINQSFTKKVIIVYKNYLCHNFVVFGLHNMVSKELVHNFNFSHMNLVVYKYQR